MQKIAKIWLLILSIIFAFVSPKIAQDNSNLYIYTYNRVNPPAVLTEQFYKYSTNNIELSKGMFLIARPDLPDPNFAKTVILLIEYSNGGTVGLVINRPSNVRLKKILPEIKGIHIRNTKVFVGGPISINKLFFMVMSKEKPENSLRIFDSVYLIADIFKSSKTLTKKSIKNQFRVYAGYAGWAPGQLEYEIARGDWYIMKASVKLIFFDEPEEIWPKLINKTSAQWIHFKIPLKKLNYLKNG